MWCPLSEIRINIGTRFVDIEGSTQAVFPRPCNGCTYHTSDSAVAILLEEVPGGGSIGISMCREIDEPMVVD